MRTKIGHKQRELLGLLELVGGSINWVDLNWGQRRSAFALSLHRIVVIHRRAPRTEAEHTRYGRHGKVVDRIELSDTYKGEVT